MQLVFGSLSLSTCIFSPLPSLSLFIYFPLFLLPLSLTTPRHASERSEGFVVEDSYAWSGWAARWRELNVLPFSTMRAVISQPHIASLFRAGISSSSFSFFSRSPLSSPSTKSSPFILFPLFYLFYFKLFNIFFSSFLLEVTFVIQVVGK